MFQTLTCVMEEKYLNISGGNRIKDRFRVEATHDKGKTTIRPLGPSSP